MNIVVIGVGYVGLVTGLSLAKLGHKITFLDIDSKKISMLSNGTPTFSEPNLDLFLNDKNIKGSTQFFDSYNSIDWQQIDFVLICVQTPVDDSGELNSIFIRNVFDSLEGKILEGTVVCIKSTIHPVAINEVFDGLSMNYDDLVFNPEFLREGSAFDDFFEADRIIIGSNNKKNSEIIAKIYDGLNSEVLFMNPIKGARSWFYFSSFSIQPSEFIKLGLSLALAKLLSDLGSKFQDFRTKLKAFFLIVSPAILIAIQPDPGTMLVFSCFIFVLYREGLSGNFLLIGLFTILIAIVGIFLKSSNSVFFIGSNGQGKTNLLEAIGLCSSLRSFRKAGTDGLVMDGKDESRLFYNFKDKTFENTEILFSFRLKGPKSLEVDGEKVKRFADYLGCFPSVCLSSRDFRLVRDGPSERRKWLDMLLSSSSPEYFEALQSFHRSLKERNSLLKNCNILFPSYDLES